MDDVLGEECGPADESTRNEIVRLCGGLPLALRIAAVDAAAKAEETTATTAAVRHARGELLLLQSLIPGGAVRASRPAPRNLACHLPPEVKHFSGREAELATLDALLSDAGEKSPATATTCVISGPGGVGKTSLAVHWSQKVSDRFPDGHLYMNLQGFSSVATPVPATQAVRTMLGFLQPSHHHLPADLEEQIRL
ncbi:hypothetical protein C1I98_17680 [Spongiactinospora gelatinilytica]|uniref:Orc1-like AAA ATPase domain-containing protein n=1 Tax=Spongiactinospora gelatinilytica TaxID=2666298 RepID=A0A2W2G2G4_9ACTN|nr:AAA family ATPase [Spongiactinospora gelatinilytica]PZG44116.1 hypothetical protein C1I98_17680 [Spongiactinospora gelatinilytica]